MTAGRTTMDSGGIFIGYSRKDAALLQEFLTWLKPLEHLGITPWIDKDITSGEDWDREIQGKLRSCRAAVLLSSPDFDASDYVTKRELPVLFRERATRGLLVVPLYLRTSNHALLSDDIRYSRLRGLNDPDEPIGAFHGDARDVAWKVAVARLVELLNKESARVGRDPLVVPVLTLRVDRKLTDVRRTWYVHGHKEGEYSGPLIPTGNDLRAIRSLAANESMGDLLWKTLFPPEAAMEWGRALCAAYRRNTPVPNPATGPLRIRLVTEIPELRALRWSCVEFEGQQILDREWTVEFATELPASGITETRIPAPALLLLDDDMHAGLSGRGTATELREIWSRTWPKSPDDLRVLDRWPNKADLDGRRAAEVLVYVGRASVNGDEVSVQLGSGEPFSIEKFAQLVDPERAIVLLSLRLPSGESIGSVAELSRRVPMVVVQWSSPDQADAARRARAAWWSGFLAGREIDADPIVSAHRHALVPTQVWTSRERYRVLRDAPHVERQVRLRLDRALAKRQIFGEVQDLFRHGSRLRTCCVLVSGSASHRVDLFHSQLHADLSDRKPTNWSLAKYDVTLPPSATFLLRDVETELRRLFGALGDDSLAETLLDRLGVSNLASDIDHVVLLSFAARGGKHGPMPDEPSLEAWLDCCATCFDATLGSNVRVIPVLQIVDPSGPFIAHAERMHADERFRQSHFRYLTLELDDVPLKDLIHFIDDEETGCPEPLKREFPELLHGVTKGDFDQTADWIERAYQESWDIVMDDLKARQAERAQGGST